MAINRLVILASGRGSNFSAIARAVANGKIPHAQVVGLISNKESAPVLQVAKEFGIPAITIPSKSFRKNGKFDRTAYESKLIAKLEILNPTYICLAGYMLLLGTEVVERWKDRILNIHPSLLPAFKGLHPHKQALAAKVKITGCTVHLVNHEMDSGQILAQQTVTISQDETEKSLSEKLLPIEHQTYVEALSELCQ